MMAAIRSDAGGAMGSTLAGSAGALLTGPVTSSKVFNAYSQAPGLAPPTSTDTPRCNEAVFDHQFRFRGVQLLLVEDNDLNRELALGILRRAGIIVSVACDGQEAVDMLSRQRFDGVLMDCQMPVLDGYAATRLLREQAQWIDLPVIAMTASILVGAREKSLAAGMNDHIVKPIKAARLFGALARWVRPRTGHFGKTSELR